MKDEFEKCKQEEATHVMILSEDEEDLTSGGLYAYFYDPDPSEETHYVIQDNGVPFYDFECVIKVDYYKIKRNK